MIEHRKSAVFNALFVAYARRLLRTGFAAIRVDGLDRARAALAAGPAVFVSNHTAWWDGIVLMWLANYAFRPGPSDGYALMDARNLKKFPFFRRLGVFGVDLEDAGDRAAVIDYAVGLLDRPGRLVWIFPQGAERPVTEPLVFRAGAARVAVGAGVPVVPMAVRYEHGRFPKPTIYLAFGEPLPAGAPVDEAVAAQQQAVAGLLAVIEAEVRAAARGQGTFPAALGGEAARAGIAARVLAWMLGARR